MISVICLLFGGVYYKEEAPKLYEMGQHKPPEDIQILCDQVYRMDQGVLTKVGEEA